MMTPSYTVRSIVVAMTVVWACLAAVRPTSAQALSLVPLDAHEPVTVTAEADFGWPKATRTPDRVIWQAAIGALTIVYTSHPQRSGLEGLYRNTPGDCVMRIERPDLVAFSVAIGRTPHGDHLRFTSPSGTQRAYRVRVSAGCDVTSSW